MKGEVVPEAGVAEGEEALQLSNDETLGKESSGRAQGRIPLDLVFHEAAPILCRNEPMVMDPFSKGTRELLVLEEAILFESRVPELPSDLAGALLDLEDDASSVSDSPLALHNPDLNPRR